MCMKQTDNNNPFGGLALDSIETNVSDVTKRFRTDFEKWVAECSAQTNSAAFRELSNKADLSEKMIRKTIKGETIPSPKSLLKVYRVFLNNCKTKTDFLNQLPQVIFERVKNESAINEMTFSSKIEEKYFKYKMMSCSIYRWIVLEAARSNAHTPLTTDRIKYEFARQGLEVLDELMSTSVLKGTESGSIFHIEIDSPPQMDKELNLWLAKHFVNEKTTTDNIEESSNAYNSWYINSVNKKTYDKILSIASKANKEIQDLASSGPEVEGDIKFFSAMFVNKEGNTRGGLQ